MVIVFYIFVVIFEGKNDLQDSSLVSFRGI